MNTKNTITVVVVLALITAAVLYWYFFLAGVPGGTIYPGTNMPGVEPLGPVEGPQSMQPLSVASSNNLGAYVTALSGFTLYAYDADTTASTSCAGECINKWTPYVVFGRADTLTSAEGLTGTISTTTRPEGSEQITYNGKPLYFYSGDKKVGDTNGQDVDGVWHVVKP